MNYREEELAFILSQRKQGLSQRDIAKEVNETFYGGRFIMTWENIGRILRENTVDPKPRFTRICDVCEVEFETSRVNSKYCSDSCRSVIRREGEKSYYDKDPPRHVRRQTIARRARDEIRWREIFERLGDKCSCCGQTFPRVVYDLHHPNGKASRKETPSQVIRLGSKETFGKMLEQVVILCANCHRLTHLASGDWAPRHQGVG